MNSIVLEKTSGRSLLQHDNALAHSARWTNGEYLSIEGFSLSMENIPRQKSFACLSLKFGCIISALIIIMYSVLSLAQCTATIGDQAPYLSTNNLESMLTFGLLIVVTIAHAVTMLLTALMLVGTLREKAHQIRPWVVWTSVQLMVSLLLFLFWTTMNLVTHAGGNTLPAYVFEFLSLLLRFYMLMLVASYYRQLEDEQHEGERLKSLTHNDVWYNTA